SSGYRRTGVSHQLAEVGAFNGEGVVHGAPEPHRGDEESASVAGHRSSVVYFRGACRRILAFSAPRR
ncbi:MAG: hypothetical protein D6723_12365, partial [Acidobacteria bacterium]